MNLLETLQAHKGGLICLKTELYWYDRRSWDGTPGRICLILDATASATAAAEAAAAAAFLLIDGQPQWIWAAAEDIELLVNDPPAN